MGALLVSLMPLLWLCRNFGDEIIMGLGAVVLFETPAITEVLSNYYLWGWLMGLHCGLSSGRLVCLAPDWYLRPDKPQPHTSDFRQRQRHCSNINGRQFTLLVIQCSSSTAAVVKWFAGKDKVSELPAPMHLSHRVQNTYTYTVLTVIFLANLG